MKKIVQSRIFLIVICGIFFTGLGVYASTIYQASDISYAPTDASWEVSNVNEAINSLYNIKNELSAIKSIGDATAAQILSGKKAVVKGSTVTGTMTNRGAVTSSLNAGGSYTIPVGYHNGSGKITANSLASQTSATATASDIASGKTAWVNGTKVTGTKQNISSKDVYEVTSGQGNKTLTLSSLGLTDTNVNNYILQVTSIPDAGGTYVGWIDQDNQYPHLIGSTPTLEITNGNIVISGMECKGGHMAANVYATSQIKWKLYHF